MCRCKRSEYGMGVRGVFLRVKGKPGRAEVMRLANLLTGKRANEWCEEINDWLTDEGDTQSGLESDQVTSSAATHSRSEFGKRQVSHTVHWSEPSLRISEPGTRLVRQSSDGIQPAH